MRKPPPNEFYCIDMHNLEPGDLLNALKALTENKLNAFVSIGKDSLGKAHAFRFFDSVKMTNPQNLLTTDEEAFLPMMATRFNKSVARVRYDLDKQEGVLHVSDPKGDLKAETYKLEPLPAFPGRLFERPLTWTDPVWVGSGNPPGRPERPANGTPGYDKPLEPGSYIGAFEKWSGAVIDAVKIEIDRTATGELTLKADDGIEGRFWFEQGTCVGLVLDTMRGAAPDKTWDAVQKETFTSRRFRMDVPRPEHIPYLKGGNNKLLKK